MWYHPDIEPINYNVKQTDLFMVNLMGFDGILGDLP
jgi:hypothetical protein